ncbi:hypothetical protein [Acidianus sp. HS-5]|uniref:hypothetical protein n=1 Tax=Acidianus sp. HS-5 TaxID=2886040 RepID=UPI001F3C1244|nr:hypothetical protein [Acidianus sp. HS-5]BDC17724.1 hypothetical protein HS5_06140 [Acidianus sp. HS-5]
MYNKIAMLEQFTLPFEEYYGVINAVKNRNFPLDYVEKMKDYLMSYEDDLLNISEYLFAFLLNPRNIKQLSEEIGKINEDLEIYNSILENNTTIGEYRGIVLDGLIKLIDGLKKNEDAFYDEVLRSENPNFLITTYYSLYLRYLTNLYVKLNKINLDPDVKAKDSPYKSLFSLVNLLVWVFGIPIIIYIRKKEVLPILSELSGILLYVLASDNVSMPSKDSLGYYLFLKIHADES